MDLGGQADRAKFMIRHRGSNFTDIFDAVLVDAGIRTVLGNVRTPRMNAIAERWIGGCRRELLDQEAILIQKSIHADSIISKSNSTANLRRLFQHYRPKADMTCFLNQD